MRARLGSCASSSRRERSTKLPPENFSQTISTGANPISAPGERSGRRAREVDVMVPPDEHRSPDGAKRNPGSPFPLSASLHAGYGILPIPPPPGLLRVAEQRQQLAKALLRRLAGGVENEVRLGIERLAARQNRNEIVHGPIVVGHWAQVALLDDAPHMFLGIGLEPHGPAARGQQLERARLGDKAAAGRQHEARLALQHRFERGALVAAKHLLAEQLEQLAQADPALSLDLAVELDERHAQVRREPAAQRGLPRSAQTNQRNPLRPHVARSAGEACKQQVARRGEIRRRQPVEKLGQQQGIDRAVRPLVDELGQGHADRLRHPAQQHDGEIAGAGFELRQISLRHFGVPGEQLARHAAAAAHRAYPLADAPKKFRESISGRLLGRPGYTRRPCRGGRTAAGFRLCLGHRPIRELHYNASQKQAAVNSAIGCRRRNSLPGRRRWTERGRVVLLMLDTIDFPVAFWGAIRAGILPVPLNTLLTPEQYAYMLEDSRAEAIVISAPLTKAIEPILDRLTYLRRVVIAAGSGDGRAPAIGRLETHRFADVLNAGGPEAWTAPTVGDEVAFWLYSSGSTGAPKGVKHVHSSLMATARLYGKSVLDFAPHDLVFSAAKLFFAYGLGNSMSFPMSVGASAVLVP